MVQNEQTKEFFLNAQKYALFFFRSFNFPQLFVMLCAFSLATHCLRNSGIARKKVPVPRRVCLVISDRLILSNIAGRIYDDVNVAFMIFFAT